MIVKLRCVKETNSWKMYIRLLMKLRVPFTFSINIETLSTTNILTKKIHQKYLEIKWNFIDELKNIIYAQKRAWSSWYETTIKPFEKAQSQRGLHKNQFQPTPLLSIQPAHISSSAHVKPLTSSTQIVATIFKHKISTKYLVAKVRGEETQK